MLDSKMQGFLQKYVQQWFSPAILFLGLISGIAGTVLAYKDFTAANNQAANERFSNAQSLEEETQTSPHELQDQATPSGMLVYVSGAVKKPGVYTLLQDENRVFHAIEKAGGFSSQANKTYIAKTLNMVDRMKDGERIYVPMEVDDGIQNIDSVQNIHDNIQQQKQGNTQGIDLNSASQQELEQLNGIGERRAAQIIQGRPYADINDFRSRSGLPNSIVDALEKQINFSTD